MSTKTNRKSEIKAGGSFGEFFKFENEKDSIAGMVIGYTEKFHTVNGETDVLTMATPDGKQSTFISAGLASFGFANRIGQFLEIEYQGKATNEKTKREYKKFGVYEIEDIEVNDEEKPF